MQWLDGQRLQNRPLYTDTRKLAWLCDFNVDKPVGPFVAKTVRE